MTAIGIDLGTTNSLVAWCHGGAVEVFENLDGHAKTPSVVSLSDDGFVVGRRARNRLLTDTERTVASIKRHMGEERSLALGSDGFTPTELSSAILTYLKRSAEAALDAPVTEAVVTVPAYFDHRQRVATREAAELAGLNVLRLLNEPTAACLPYGIRERGNDTTVLVYDLGGGTFDASIVDVFDGIFEVLGTDGDDLLGGDDWDGAIVDWLLDRLVTDYDVTVPDPVPPTLEERLFDAARRAKHDLSTRVTADVRIPYLEVGDEVVNVDERLTRDAFERMNAGRLGRTVDICRSLIGDVGPSTVDEIVLVGGATRMPMVKAALSDAFGIDPLAGQRVDEAVARGAAIQAVALSERALPEADRSGDVPAVPGDGGDGLVLVDSTPKALGVEVFDSSEELYFSTIVPRHASIPARNTRTGYTTVEDFQRYVRIPVLQSATATLEDAEELDVFEFGPVPERLAGRVEFSVEFMLTEDGTLTVSVADAEGFAREEISISSAVETTPDELTRPERQLPDVVDA